MNICVSKKFLRFGSHKIARVDWSKQMLQKYSRGASKHVNDIATGDESWLYAYEAESKQQSFQDETNPTKVARARSTSGKTEHVASVPLEQRRTVNSE